MPHRLPVEQSVFPVQPEPATWRDYLKATLVVAAIAAPSFALVFWTPEGFARNLAGVWFGITLLFLLIGASFTFMAIVAPGDRASEASDESPLGQPVTPGMDGGASPVGRQPGRRRAA